jgi:hypothetical protein
VHVFNVNDADPEARKGMLVRDYERKHVDAIKARMIRNPAAMVLPWAVVIVGLKKPIDFEMMEKVYNYEYTFIHTNRWVTFLETIAECRDEDSGFTLISNQEFLYRN